jgi:hypothetical protein
MKKRILWVVIETALAAAIMWIDVRLFYLYLFGVLIWVSTGIRAALAANQFELRVHLETIQNRVGVLPTDATVIIERTRENMAEDEWKALV